MGGSGDAVRCDASEVLVSVRLQRQSEESVTQREGSSAPFERATLSFAFIRRRERDR